MAEGKRTPESENVKSCMRYELDYINEGLNEAAQLQYPSKLSQTHTPRPTAACSDIFSHEVPEERPIRRSTTVGTSQSPLQQDLIKRPIDLVENESDNESSPAPAFNGDIKFEDYGKLEQGYEPDRYGDGPRLQLKESQLMKYEGLKKQQGTQKKREKRGLAEISYRVKQIVSRCQKLSYKKVSDEVLNGFQMDLPTEVKARESESRNIRRRVYDALNVLVAVNILGRLGREVIFTDHTQMLGRKLSSQWDAYNIQQTKLAQLIDTCKEKQKNLRMMLWHYHRVKAIRRRNQRIEQANQYSQPGQKYHFPLLFCVPSAKSNFKMNVTLETFYLNGQHTRIKIQGKDMLSFSDSNAVKYIDLVDDGFKQELDERLASLISLRISKKRDTNEI